MNTATSRTLLACGVLSALLYIAMNVFIPMQWQDYSAVSQTISELSAIGAPTRPLWVTLGTVYTLLVAAFGIGVWMSAADRRLRVTGGLLFFSGLFGLIWPPMHLRGAPFGLTDTLHIVWSAVTLLIMLVVMALAATALGKWFRVYTIVTVAIWFVFGTLTGIDGPNIAENLPTPWIGVWERINVAAYMLWVVVFAITLWRTKVAITPASGRGSRPFVPQTGGRRTW